MVDYSVRGSIALITLKYGTLNVLGEPIRRGIRSTFEKAKSDRVKAIVICGANGNFSAGADIMEFSNATASLKEPLAKLLNFVENSTIPVVAAIHGYALGGGFELALACHYRVASANAIVGFPEVKLGMLPGAGGTQRFPRLVGLDAAMEWIYNGKHYTANDAAQLGVFDRIVPDGTDVVSEAISYACTILLKPLVSRRACEKVPPDATMAEEVAAKHLKLARQKSRGLHCPADCIQAVKNAAYYNFEGGMKRESQILESLMSSGQRKAMTYAFFSERNVQKWKVPGTNVSWKNSPPKTVKLGAVIGLGTMGRGIAINFLAAGIPVIVTEMNEKFLESGLKAVRTIIDDMQRRGMISEARNAEMKSAVSGTLNYSDLKDVDLVIEAVFEDIGLKKKVFKALDKACKPDAILATNTSAQDIDDIASVTQRPDKVIGMHFFAPANLMRLLENVYGSKTSAETIATCMKMGKAMAKVTVLVGNCYGFVANRMYFHYLNEAQYLLEEGASPKEVDNALTDYGFAMGTFQVGDLSGIDVGYRLRMAMGITAKQQPPGTKENERGGLRYCPLADYLCEKGRYGLKTKKGWYDYPNGRTPHISPEVMQIIEGYRGRVGCAKKRIDHQEILDRMLLSLVNEGFRILDDGIATSPVDVDMVWIHGYAYPRHTGGPMFYAHTIGLPKVLQRIRSLNERFGDRDPNWQPSDMLVRLVREHGNPDMSVWMESSSAFRQKSARSNL